MLRCSIWMQIACNSRLYTHYWLSTRPSNTRGPQVSLTAGLPAWLQAGLDSVKRRTKSFTSWNYFLHAPLLARWRLPRYSNPFTDSFRHGWKVGCRHARPYVRIVGYGARGTMSGSNYQRQPAGKISGRSALQADGAAESRGRSIVVEMSWNGLASGLTDRYHANATRRHTRQLHGPLTGITHTHTQQKGMTGSYSHVKSGVQADSRQ